MHNIVFYYVDHPDCDHVRDILSEQEYNVIASNNPSKIRKLCLNHENDLALIFIREDSEEDIAIAHSIAKNENHIAVIVMIQEEDHSSVISTINAGVNDFVTYPLQEKKLHIRIDLILDNRSKSMRDTEYQRTLESMVMAKSEAALISKAKVKRQFIATIKALLKALQARDIYTEGHSRRVAKKSTELAKHMGLSETEITDIDYGALFHDIGKLAIRDEVLNKPGKLTESEFEHIKYHPIAAEEILAPIDEFVNVIKIIKHEHERWDGEGYPYKLKGEEIPIGARIVQVVDAWDSLVYDRIYRKSCSRENAIKELRKCAGTQFDPNVVEHFVEMINLKNASKTEVETTT